MSKIVFPDINLDNVKGVLADLDNTLYNFDNCHEKALRCCFMLDGFDENFENFEARFMKHRKKIMDKLFPFPSCRSRALTFQNMMENLKVKKPYEMALKYSECYWNNFFAFMEIDEKALTFLKLCKEKQIPVCLVTDMLIEVQIKKVVKLNISDYIEYIVSSEEAGIEKPDEKIFTTALKKLKIKPSEAIMIGDCYEKDIVGADNLGIKSYQVEVLNSTRK